MDTADPPAILLGGHITAVPVARSLGRAGVAVHAVGPASEPVRRSRYCTKFAALEEGVPLQEGWLRWLRQGPRRGVIMPCADDALELVSRNRAELVELGYTPFEADDEVLLAMLDKHRTYEIARRVGVPTPHTETVRTGADVARAVEGFPLPCGVKPLHGHLFAERAGIRAKVIVVEERDELRRMLERMVGLGLEMMVTELVQGGDDQIRAYFTYMDEDGRPLFHFTNRKLRQNPIHFGVGSYVVGEWDAEVAELGLRFLEGAGLRGVAHVEFKRDARDGGLRLIECNHRFNLAIALVCRSRIDLPLLTYNRLAGRPGPPLPPPRYGVHLWHPASDLNALVQYRRAGELSVGGWVRSLMHRQHFSLFSWSDPLPGAPRPLARVRQVGRDGLPWGGAK